jgi:hypothetical protein
MGEVVAYFKIAACTCKDRGNLRSLSVTIAGNQTQILCGVLTNTNIRSSRYINPLGSDQGASSDSEGTRSGKNASRKLNQVLGNSRRTYRGTQDRPSKSSSNADRIELNF